MASTYTLSYPFLARNPRSTQRPRLDPHLTSPTPTPTPQTASTQILTTEIHSTYPRDPRSSLQSHGSLGSLAAEKEEAQATRTARSGRIGLRTLVSKAVRRIAADGNRGSGEVYVFGGRAVFFPGRK